MTKMQIDDYLNVALTGRGSTSDRGLSRALGLSGIGASTYRTKGAVASLSSDIAASGPA